MLPQLICLPPAGAGPSIYQPWARQYRGRLDVYPVTLPGKEARLVEPLPQSLETLADGLVEQILPRLAPRYAIFGYSMGAALGYEIYRRFARRGVMAPEIFFLLGSNPPDRLLDGRAPIHQLQPDAFKQELIAIGGTPTEILENAEAMALFEPALRNDFQMCETYDHFFDNSRIPCPVHGFVADSDHLVKAETAAGWSNFVSGSFTLHQLTGSHMLDREAFALLPERLLTLWNESASQREVRIASFG